MPSKKHRASHRRTKKNMKGGKTQYEARDLAQYVGENADAQACEIQLDQCRKGKDYLVIVDGMASVARYEPPYFITIKFGRIYDSPFTHFTEAQVTKIFKLRGNGIVDYIERTNRGLRGSILGMWGELTGNINSSNRNPNRDYQYYDNLRRRLGLIDEPSRSQSRSRSRSRSRSQSRSRSESQSRS